MAHRERNDMARWHDALCCGCGECSACLYTSKVDNNNHSDHLNKRYVRVGTVRYGVRLGAVSPPPPGAGPRYRSQCCWPTTTTTAVVSATSELPASRIPLLTAINSRETADSDVEPTSAAVRGQQLIDTTRSLLLRRRTPVYDRLCDCDDAASAPRFRFGGNRDHKQLRELMERRRKPPPTLPGVQHAPVPPPRTRHATSAPLRSASFSEVDYHYPTVESGKSLTTISGGTLPRTGKNNKCNNSAIQTSTPALPEEVRSTDTPLTVESDCCMVRTLQEKKNKSRRRKGIYLDQWPNSVLPVGGEYPGDDNPVKKDTSFLDIPCVRISTEGESLVTTTPITPEDDSVLQPDWPSPTPEDKNNLKVSKPPQLLRADSLSEGEVRSDASDCESRSEIHPRRYSKRPLRGPYGQMLEAEMKKLDGSRKNQCADLKFLEDLSPPTSGTALSTSSSMGAADAKKCATARARCNHSLDETQLKHSAPSLQTPTSPSKGMGKRKASVDSAPVHETTDGGGNTAGNKLVVSHQRTTSSPSKLEGFTPTEASNELLEQLLRGSSEQLALNDTRTHVVIELYDTERHYVESLHILVTKYLEPLKSPENAGLLDAALADEIFYQIPTLYSHHNVFLDELKKRLDTWDVKQKVGDVLINMYSNPVVIESYTNYVNNCKRAREIYKTAQHSKPAFARFLGAMAKEHKGKLALDELLIKPIQIFPKYELLLQRLIAHTNTAHPDHALLLSAQRELHEQILKINCTEREALGLDQLREIEGLVEGLCELVAADRQYLRHDSVHAKAPGGGLKERAIFLFSDLLLVTSIKRRSGTARKPASSSASTVGGVAGTAGTLEANKYKLLTRAPLDEVEIVRARDDNVRQTLAEIERLNEDISTLNQIQELVWSLHRSHAPLDELVREMQTTMGRQLSEHQSSDAQLCCLDLSVGGSAEVVSLVFPKPEKRATWEESFNEAKHKLAMSGDRRPHPELLATVPIRKTRAGLQFTCAAPTLGERGHDVWVCNSDGYVGQVCVLSLRPEPNVISCNGVCNARILCVAAVPGLHSLPIEDTPHAPPTVDSDSGGASSSEGDERSDDEERAASSAAKSSAETVSTDSAEESDTTSLSTMWLGAEDGCVHVYNAGDNIRIKKNKIRLQHAASILCIIYLENRVFVSLANGDLTIYERDSSGTWNTNSPTELALGSAQQPVTKMLPHGGRLWCASGNSVKLLNVATLEVERTLAAHADAHKTIACLEVSGSGVWLSLQNAAVLKCYHTDSFELLCEVNVAPAVTKMLSSCDDIIRQHKAACLRVTALLACKELLWIGTSAGVLLTMPLPHIGAGSTKLATPPTVAGVPHGHTGHVRFLSRVDNTEALPPNISTSTTPATPTKQLVISGGDGYEDFRNATLSEVAGREDSTNHLLLWNI